MTLIAAPATPGLWVDSNTVLTSSVCAALVQAGKLGVARYVPFAGLSRLGCISAEELEVITAASLQCVLVSHVRGTPAGNFHWHPSAFDGAVDAAAAIGTANFAGYPHGAHIFLDLEGISDGPAQTAAYAQDWQRAVIASGYKAGLYYGFDCPLDANAKYLLPGDCYWSAPGQGTVATRGVAIRQGTIVTIGGVQFDEDTVAPDLLGGLPFVAARVLAPNA
jgi:hypothetical protein